MQTSSRSHSPISLPALSSSPLRRQSFVRRLDRKMGKVPVRMKAVVFALSPFQQKVMPGLWKDLPGKLSHKVTENWLNATLLLSPLVGVYSYVQYYQEKEKLEHRY